MPTPKFKPMPGKIVVKTVGESEFLDRSKLIFAPATRANPRTTGVIIAVYEAFTIGEVETEPFLKVGDKVIFGMHSGIEIEYGREKVVILREQEILTIVEVEEDADIEQIGVATNKAFDDIDG
jgi:co-chaperonin GroES (HSP10)